MVASCATEYDDTAVWDEFNKYNERLTKLEQLCQQMNTNISSLQAIVTALQNNDYVTSVVPINQNGVEVGYVITFSKSGTITIYHGKDGKDGYTPQIGVKKDCDNIYYWTLDGQWLLDEAGNKIKAQGTDGKDGDNGANGKDGVDGTNGTDGKYGADGANGADGKDGVDGQDGYSFFQKVEQDERFLYLTLADGTVFTVPRRLELDIIFDTSALKEVRTNSEIKVPYYVNSSCNSVVIEVVPSNDLRAEVISNDKTYKEGYILIRTSSDFDAASRVVVLVSDGEKIVMKSIAITVIEEERDVAQLYIYNGATKNVSKDGGAVSLSFLTNVECEAVIPKEAQDWISLFQTRALTRQTITLNVSPNSGSSRSAKVKVQSLDGALSVEYSIVQFSAVGAVDPDVDVPADNQIFYTSSDGKVVQPANPNVFGAVIIANDYADGRGVITFDRAVSHIGERAFSVCSNLTSVTIPDSVTKIEEGVFRGCSSLTSVTIGNNVTTIGESVFQGCSSLTSVTIPDSVTVIEYAAFYGCSNLTSVTIGDRVTGIGFYAFYNCSSLTSVTIPDSVTTIGGYAFASCSSLTSVTIGNRVTTIDSSVFSGCSSLTSVTIPDSVTRIVSSAFEQCNSLASVTIGAGVENISEHAFRYCYFLKDIYCRAIVPPAINSNIFEGIGIEAKIYVPNVSVEAYKMANGWKEYANQIVGYNYESFSTYQIIYTSIDGLPIAPSNSRNIISNTYESNQGIITMGCHNNDMLIWDNLFSDCSTLTSVVIPEGVTTIRSNAFSYCNNLTSVTIPDSVIVIGDGVFRGCSSLTGITIPDGVTRIEGCLFQGCNSLASVNIPNKVTSIGGYAFEDCNSITNIAIPDSVNYISGQAFYNCRSLTSITIPNSVTIIKHKTFLGCSSLVNITISGSVTEIEYLAFSGCNFKEVYCKATTPPIGYGAMFGYNSSGCKIYVPASSVDAYKAANGWQDYADTIEPYNF